MAIVLTANITPGGTFPIVLTDVISGGYRTVANIAARDAIPTVGVNSEIALDGYRVDGMLVYVQSTGDTYMLIPPFGNANWVLQTAVQAGDFPAIGAILVGDGVGSFASLPVGPDGEVLTADSGEATGVKWQAISAVQAADYTAIGVVLVGDGVGSFAGLPVGADGEVLTADSGEATGVKWVAGGGGGGIPVPVAAPTDLYVSGLNGNDLNDGSTPLLAVATLSRAWELIPYTLAGPLVVHLGAAGLPGVPYAWAPMPSPAQLTPDARIWLYGDGAGQVGEDGFEVVAGSPVVAAGGTDANQITTAAIVADAYQGFTLEVVNGPAAGYRRTILTNTTSSIIPCRRFETEDTTTAVTPVAGNTIRILRPTVIFSGYDTAGNTDGIPGLFSGIGNGDGGAPLLLVNLAFASVVNQTEINRCTIFGAGIEFRGTIAPIFTNCNGSFGNWDNVFDTSSAQGALPQGTNLSLAKTNWFTDIALALSPSPLATWRGWGVSQPDVVAVSAATTGLRFLTCQMSMFATVGDIHGSSCNLSLGGRFFGDVTLERGFYHLLGRSSGASGSILFRRQIRTELCTVIAEANAGSFDFTYSATVDHQWASISCDVQLLNNGTFVSATSGVTFLKMTGGGTFELGVAATWAFTYALDAATSRGLIQVADGTFTTGLSLTATNTLTGAITAGAALLSELAGVIQVRGTACSIVGNVGATVGNLGVLIRTGAQLQTVSTLVTLTDARIDVDGGIFVASGAITIVNASTKPAIVLSNRGSFTQTVANISCTGFITSSASEWLSSGGSLSVSSTNPLRLNDGSKFVATATAGAWSLLSTVAGAAVTSIDSELIVDAISLTLTSLAAATAAIIATYSQIRLAPITLTFTLGGITLNSSSDMSIGVNLAITGALSTTQNSTLATAAVFSTTLANTITDSKCSHQGATTYTAAVAFTSSKMFAAAAITFTAAPSILSSDLVCAASAAFTAGATLTDSLLDVVTGITAGGNIIGTNSVLIVRTGNITSTFGIFLTRSSANVSAVVSCTVLQLATTVMHIGTNCTASTNAQLDRETILSVGGNMSSAGSVFLTELSELVVGGNLTPGSLLANSSSVQVAGLTTAATTINMALSQATFSDLMSCSSFSISQNCEVRSANFNISSASVSGASIWVTGGIVNVIGTITIDTNSFVSFGSDVSATGGLTLSNGSYLYSFQTFSVAGATIISDSECLHRLSSAYNSSASNIVTRSKISSAGTLTFGTSLLTLTQSEVIAAVASTFNGAVNATSSMINCAGTCIALSTVTCENSVWYVDNANMSIISSFTVLRSTLEIDGNFDAASASLTDSNMSVTGTYASAGTTTVQRDSSLTVTGILNTVALSVLESKVTHNGVATCTGAVAVNNSLINSTATFTGSTTITAENSTWNADGANLTAGGTCTLTRCDLNIDGNFSAGIVTLTDTNLSAVGTYTATGDTTVQRDSSLVVTGTLGATALSVLESRVTHNGVATCTGAVILTDAQINSTANFSTTSTINGENSTWNTDGANLSSTGTFTLLRCGFNINGTLTIDQLTLTDSDVSVTSTFLDNGPTVLNRASKLVVTGSLTTDNIAMSESSSLLAENALTTGTFITVDDSTIETAGITAGGVITLIHAQAAFTGRLDCLRLVVINSNLETVDFVIDEQVFIQLESTWHAKGTVASSINASATVSGLQILNARVNFRSHSGLVDIQSDGLGTNPAIYLEGSSAFIWNNTDVQTLASPIGLENKGGAAIVFGAPTNIVGFTADFTDQQGNFSDTQLIVGRTMFVGQHPAGVYSAVAIPVGTSTYQVL